MMNKDMISHDQLKEENKLLIHYLTEIARLSDVTEIRGAFEDVGAPEHHVTKDGWVPIDPRTKRGLDFAARIAQQALEVIREKRLES